MTASPIHDDMELTAATAIAMIRALSGEADRLCRRGEAYAQASGALLKGLIRHLDDGEDLIVPLILDRDEAALRVAQHNLRRLMPLEVLDVAFVLLGRLAGVEGAEVAPPAGFRIDLARIKPVLAAFEFSDHGALLAAPIRRDANRSFTNRTGRSRRNSGAPGSSRGSSLASHHNARCGGASARLSYVRFSSTARLLRSHQARWLSS